MIGGAKGIGIGIDFGIPNQYCRATSKPYIEKDVLDSLRVVASAYGKSNDDADRSIVKNLVDASNPFIISNAAFKLNSGFGEYKEDFTSWRIYPNIKVTDNVITTNGNFNSTWFIYKHSSESKINEMNIKVSGIPKGGKILYFYISDETANLPIAYTIPKDGIYHLPESKINNNRVSVGFTVESSYDWNNIRIEQIPSFEGAFVTDGVNDLITSTKTVQEMGITDEVTVVSMIHQIDLNSTYTIATTNYIENSNSREHVRSDVYNYGKTGIYGYSASLINNTKSDIKNILGDEADYYVKSTNSLQTIFDAKFSVVGRISELTEASQVAWYWTIIANKVLTTDQINQVIAYFNLDRTLNPDILCNTIKQGITNENHAEFGDKLIDFSGNGRDIQLNNIAWKGDSGIGKYETDFTTWTRSHFTDEVNFTPSKIEVTGILTTNSILINNKPTPIYNVEIHSPNKSIVVYYQYNDDTGVKRIALVDGINELPSANDSLFVTSDRLNSKGITITQIPSHAGALCLDGVNDFGKVTGMPVYKDYTVVTDREIFANIGAILSKNNPGAFVETAGNSVYSFGQATSGLKFISTRSISYLSKYSYCGQSIAAGAAEDVPDMWLGTIRDGDSRFFNGAIYSLMSFPYSMSEFLIERQLKKHKLGTLYPDMVEFRPIVKSNSEYQVVDYYIDTFPAVVGNYYPINSKLRIAVTTKGEADEVTSLTVNGVSLGTPSVNGNRFTFNGTLSDKSPQKINITIDEYIRFEDIVQPYPLFFEFTDENNNLISWGGKAKVGSTITRTKGVNYANLLEGLFTITNPRLNGVPLSSSQHVVEKSMVFTCTATWAFDNNKPKSILSPRLLRIPNSSYKILGYIPDISGHNNNGIIHNSAYAEGSGVNEDGSYQFDGVDDFVAIPTLSSGGKQVLMKANWQSNIGDAILYDQRFNVYNYEFAIYNSNTDNYSENPHAYSSRNNGKTYIDGILNTYIKSAELQNVTHNIIATNELSSGSIPLSPIIGSNISHDSAFAQMSLYDFMLFDEISTDDKIKELNEYVGIEGDVWGILTQLSNSTLISNETLIKNE